MGEALFLFADHERELNTSLFRIGIPAKYLNKNGHTIVSQYVGQFDVRAVKRVVLLERLIFPETIKLLRLAGAEFIAGTFDDAYHILPDTAGSKAFWDKNRLNEFRKGLGMCDLVMVPNSLLINDYKKYCQKMMLMPNFHDDELWVAPRPPVKKGEVKRIGWGGSLGHETTWQKTNLLEAMKVLKGKYGNRIEYMICGKIPPAIANSDLPCGFLGQWTDFEQWPGVMRSFHIGIAPLAGAYDRRRSCLKLEEIGLAGLPGVASKEGEYALCNPTGISLVDDKLDLWVAELSKLIEDDERWNLMAQASRSWAEGYLMSRNVEKYEDALFA